MRTCVRGKRVEEEEVSVRGNRVEEEVSCWRCVKGKRMRRWRCVKGKRVEEEKVRGWRRRR